MSDKPTGSIVPLHGEWTPEQRAEAHEALDAALEDSDVVLIVGAGRGTEYEKWFARERGPLLTTTFLGMLQKVLLAGYQRVIDEEAEDT